MFDEELRAKVFISCGQSRGSDEREIARRVAEQLRGLGYEPYIAVEEQTLRGIKENIFQQLESSEYFIFIDFKRDRLVTEDQEIYRGSLFSHQELAIASYLNIPVIPFQEIGVKQEDGLLGFLQGNSIPFADRQLLPDLISDAVKQQRWNPHWKNQLHLERRYIHERDFVPFEIEDSGGNESILIPVRNLNLRKPALNSCVYIESIVDITGEKPISIPIKTQELTWTGHGIPNVIIAPQSFRTFRALTIVWDHPERHMLITSDGIKNLIPGGSRIPNKAAITYAVVSENFPVARASYAYGSIKRSFCSVDVEEPYFQSFGDEEIKFY